MKPICDLPLKYIHHIYGKDIIMNFTNLDNNCEFVRRSVLDLDPKYCLNKSYYPATMYVGKRCVT